MKRRAQRQRGLIDAVPLRPTAPPNRAAPVQGFLAAPDAAKAARRDRLELA